MYLHIGQDTVVRLDEVVGVFDMDNTTVSQPTRGFLQMAEKAGQVTTVGTDLPKSFIVCCPPGKRRQQTVTVAQMAPRTLQKRAGQEFMTEWETAVPPDGLDGDGMTDSTERSDDHHGK